MKDLLSGLAFGFTVIFVLYAAPLLMCGLAKLLLP